MKRALTLTTALVFLGGAASADTLRDRVVRDLAQQGYERIEITRSLTQITFEATRGDETVEYVYNRLTGDLIRDDQDEEEEGFRIAGLDRDDDEDDDREDDRDDDHDDDDREDDDDTDDRDDDDNDDDDNDDDDDDDGDDGDD
ncbi:PepSY domain-containing protein [Pseudoruegeria sp. SHC-113]|uniref:PepSY domain-containing protein n=1 Tax=Pseudoruegeria sp. SHC-113 TaxID=2855439 RepID=UPI0021BADDB6|nr:PepSY domain-containing protein [Pseudoruegeria sp. SHC-113]MCT8161859.1 PepSY domain-containing protein [Pseudoruegeria sp. SHC-113]